MNKLSEMDQGVLDAALVKGEFSGCGPSCSSCAQIKKQFDAAMSKKSSEAKTIAAQVSTGEYVIPTYTMKDYYSSGIPGIADYPSAKKFNLSGGVVVLSIVNGKTIKVVSDSPVMTMTKEQGIEVCEHLLKILKAMD